MKNSCKILALTFLLTAAFAQTQAQRGDGNSDPAQRAEQQTAMMKEKLSLSEEQAEKVGEINLKYANKIKETRDANPDSDWAAKKEAMMTLRREQDAELKGTLTAEQFENWTTIRKEQRQKGPRGEKSHKKSQEKNN